MAKQSSMTNLRRPLPFSPTPGSPCIQIHATGSTSSPVPDLPVTGKKSEVHLPSRTKGNPRQIWPNQPYTATFLWVRGRLLGQGSYSRVYMALNANTGDLMAVKQVEIKGNHKPAHRDALKFLAFESETLKELDHPNVVQYLGCEASLETLSLFLEYVPGGTIATLLNQRGRFREEVTKSFTKQILHGLGYLHSRKILHRDLKPDNVLIEPNGVCKISDFGISKHVGDMYNARKHTFMKGTIHYMAPEVVDSDGSGYDGKIDIWSVGCMLIEMWSGEKPWGTDENSMTIMWKLWKLRTPPPVAAQLAKELSPDAHDFKESCFHINPIQRPSAAELKNHTYLKLPYCWNFDINDISHPSGGKRIRLSRYRQADCDDGSTYRSNENSHDPALRQPNDDSIPASKVPRGPSPPIVIIKPIPISPRTPLPVEFPEQDYMTHGSSTSSRQKSSGRRRYLYHVANPGNDEDMPPSNYQFVPSPLPSVSPYSAHLAASSKYDFSYNLPEANPLSHFDSTPYLAPTPQVLSSSKYLSDFHLSDTSSSAPSTPPRASSRVGDDSTWKRPPNTVRPPSSSAHSSSSSSHEHGSSSSFRAHHHQATQPQIPLASHVVPLPPPPPPLTLSTSRISCAQFSPSDLPSCDITDPSMTEELSTQLALDRPNVHDVVQQLGTYFPYRDLDQPIVELSPSIHLTEKSTDRYYYGDLVSAEVDEVVLGPSTSHQHRMTRPISGQTSFPCPSIPTRFSSSHRPSYTVKRERPADSSNLGVDSPHTDYQPEGIAATSPTLAHTSARLERTKTIRQVVEERQLNPNKAHRRTLWDIKMEEIK